MFHLPYQIDAHLHSCLLKVSQWLLHPLESFSSLEGDGTKRKGGKGQCMHTPMCAHTYACTDMHTCTNDLSLLPLTGPSCVCSCPDRWHIGCFGFSTFIIEEDKNNWFQRAFGLTIRSVHFNPFIRNARVNRLDTQLQVRNRVGRGRSLV